LIIKELYYSNLDANDINSSIYNINKITKEDIEQLYVVWDDIYLNYAKKILIIYFFCNFALCNTYSS